MGLLGAIVSPALSVLDSQNKKAAKKATKAVEAAADKNRALFEQIYNQSRSDLAPYNQAGQRALSAYEQRLGLTPMNRAPQTRPSAPGAAQPPTTAPGGQGMNTDTLRNNYGYGPAVTDALSQGAPQAPQAAQAPQGGGVNYQQLFADRPDVMAQYQRVAAQADPNSPQYQALGLDRGPEGFADYWLQSKPPEDTYAAPTMAPDGAQQPAPDPNAPADEYYQEDYGQRPDELALPTYERAPDMEAPTYGEGPQFSYSTKDVENDPGFRFALKEGLDSVNSSFAARGRLRGGGALKALQDRGTGVAHQFDNDFFSRALQGYNANRNAFESDRGFTENRYRYGQDRGDRNFLDDRSYGTNLWNTRQSRADNVFDVDRGFAAGRNDQQNANLFNLMTSGQNAAAGTANAGNIFAGNVAQGNNNVAQTTANGALWRQGQLTNLFGTALRTAGQFAGGF